jgi:TetR/AcrR family transcriptional repressor of nem operon
MGHSQSAKLRTHERILDIAAKRFRERGIEGTSISDIMKDAGVTVGGFYKHFPSKEDMVTEAVAAAFSNTAQWNDLARAELANAIDQYLSSAQNDDLASCAVFSSLAADIRRSNPATRKVFDGQLQEALAAIAQGLGENHGARREGKAAAILAALVGASLLARGTSDGSLAEKLLSAVADELRITYFSEATASS